MVERTRQSKAACIVISKKEKEHQEEQEEQGEEDEEKEDQEERALECLHCKLPPFYTLFTHPPSL